MPYQVNQLLKGLGSPVTADPDESLRDALNRMLHHGFSQLPAVKGSGQNRQFYFVTHESILIALHNFGSTLETTGLRVGDALVKVSAVYSASDDLFELLMGMRDTNAALIVDADRNLTHVVTSYDTSQYFRQWAEDIMQVRDVEYSLRRIVNSAFRKSDGEVDEGARRVAIEDITPSNRTLRKKFDLAVKQYVEEAATLETSVVSEWLNAAFLTLLGTSTPKVNKDNTDGPGIAEDVATDLAQPPVPSDLPMLLGSLNALHSRLESAVHCYLVQKAKNAGRLDDSLLEQAFSFLYNKKEEIKEFGQLTLAEYIQLFFNGSCWERCRDVIKLDAKELKHMLEGVRDTRNMLAHFREDEITAQRRLQLRTCADWLSERERLIVSAVSAPKEGATPSLASVPAAE